MSAPRTSILLPTHNRPDSLGVSIKSVLAQTVGDFELLVVGDGVSEETRRVVAGFDDVRIRFFDLPKAPHFGYANRNVALREARGDLIAFAADDDLWLPDHLAVMVPLFEDRRVDWAHSRPVWVSPDGLALPFFADLSDPIEFDAFLTQRNILPAATVVHRRACYETVGFWPEDVAEAGDWELWKRILLSSGGRRYTTTRTPTCLHFKARRRVGESWGPPPLSEIEEIARGAP
ncbi:MAG: glycosyltransferase family 2 protein, partial [Hyphomicrobium sp.]